MRISPQTMVQVATLAFLSFVITMAHAATPPNDTIYTVQLGLFDHVTIADFDELRHAGYIYAEPLQTEGRQAIFLSNFKEKKKAESILSLVKRKGYNDAFITERPLIKGQKVHVVQIASRNSSDYIDWEKYAGIGQPYTLLEGNQVKITSVPFIDIEKAKEKLMVMQSLGFDDAFVKKTNTLMLHKVNQFNTIRDIDFSPRAISADMAMNEEGITEVDDEAMAMVIPVEIISPEEEFSSKGPSTIHKDPRQSVKSMQKFLQQQEVYDSEVDGIYGEGTAAGVNAVAKENAQYLKYQIIASETPRSAEASDLTGLDAIIMTIHTNPKEKYAALMKENSPMAKAYRAYILFVADQESNQIQINELMNKAINDAYATYDGQATFDHQSTYSYLELEQLILHTRYIQGALNEEPITPCWLFTKHKDEAYSAFAKAEAHGISTNNLQSCSGFIQWDNIILLKTIASDLNPNEGELTKELKEIERSNNTNLNKLFMIPRPLNKEDETAAVAWNDQLWSSMDLKMSEDKFFAKFGVPFKLAYHKAWIQLEDHFMEKGFKRYQANGLALDVLKSIIETDIESYL